jgi:hypothetical protein
MLLNILLNGINFSPPEVKNNSCEGAPKHTFILGPVSMVANRRS